MKNRLLIFGAMVVASVSILTGCSQKNKTVEANQYQTDVNSIAYNELTASQQKVYNELTVGIHDFQKEINISGTNKDAEIAYEAMIADHPELFYTDGYVFNEKQTIIGTASNKIIVFPNYTCTESDYTDLIKEIDKRATELTANITNENTSYEKSKSIYEVLINTIEYDTTVDANDTIVAAFIGNKATCGGYAQAYSYLMQKYDIPCTTFTGTLKDTSHMWNVSMIDEKYYLTDTTSGDSVLATANGEERSVINYGYLNMNPIFTSNYVPDEIGVNIIFDSLDANYYVQNGTYFDSYNGDEIAAAILAHKSEPQVTIAFSTADTLTYAEKILFGNKEIQNILGNVNINYTENVDMYSLTILF